MFNALRHNLVNAGTTLVTEFCDRFNMASLFGATANCGAVQLVLDTFTEPGPSNPHISAHDVDAGYPLSGKIWDMAREGVPGVSFIVNASGDYAYDSSGTWAVGGIDASLLAERPTRIECDFQCDTEAKSSGWGPAVRIVDDSNYVYGWFFGSSTTDDIDVYSYESGVDNLRASDSAAGAIDKTQWFTHVMTDSGDTIVFDCSDVESGLVATWSGAGSTFITEKRAGVNISGAGTPRADNFKLWGIKA